MEEPTKVIIREANSGSDHAFLYSTWRNALWYAQKRNPSEADGFYRDASSRIAAYLRDPHSQVRIACLSDDPDMLLGWACLVGTHLEFVYVKIDYRRKGIGRLLTKGFKTFSPPETRIGKVAAEHFLKEKAHGRKEEAKTEHS